MEKFIPKARLSKTKKRELNQRNRKSWEGTKPFVRKVTSKKVYTRKRRNKDADLHGSGVIISLKSLAFSPSLRYNVFCVL